ncbi:co-chaperone protein p23-1-like isoform X2 [Alnus glutinosa]|uniref:co-chaperone protein p23-1-like isoform X2 n=1 Tax=Alnus glutinosa TaxID=3517 RepID=UPI002D781872|nr:co-chaperone protein p23-1-like isoform X2 [Alnus glutinosa]
MSRHPSVKWAQRSDKLFITIHLPDAQDVKLKLEPEGKFFFSATSGAEKIPYEVDLDLYDKVDVNESKANIGLRNICYLVKKAENKWWSRFLKQQGRPPIFLKVDWDKWVDEDEEPENKPGTDMDYGDFDFSKLNMGGGEGFDAGATGRDYDDDSDTEEEDMEQAPPPGGEHDTKASLGGESGGEPGAKV